MEHGYGFRKGQVWCPAPREGAQMRYTSLSRAKGAEDGDDDYEGESGGHRQPLSPHTPTEHLSTPRSKRWRCGHEAPEGVPWRPTRTTLVSQPSAR